MVGKEGVGRVEAGPLLYKMREAAAMLGLSFSFVKKLCREGRIKSVLIGNARRISRAEIERVARGIK